MQPKTPSELERKLQEIQFLMDELAKLFPPDMKMALICYDVTRPDLTAIIAEKAQENMNDIITTLQDLQKRGIGRDIPRSEETCNLSSH